jgi:hypothetical protein
MTLAERIERPEIHHIERAKELLQEQLLKNQDSGVRLLASLGLPDDDPRVLRIAAALRAQEAV